MKTASWLNASFPILLKAFWGPELLPVGYADIVDKARGRCIDVPAEMAEGSCAEVWLADAQDKVKARYQACMLEKATSD